jgi:hypothetical protein
LRQAIARKTIPIHVFKIENRRGYYALVTDVDQWLAGKALPSSKAEEEK